jgi:ABC-type multidrug transport system permease subunit
MRNWPLAQLILARVREFYREPEAIFWVYGFPILMVVALGVAFRNQPVEQISVDVQTGGTTAEQAFKALSGDQHFKVLQSSEAEWRRRLRTGRVDVALVATEGTPPRYQFWYDPTRPQSLLARNSVNDALQRAAGRQDPAAVEDQRVEEPGGRYVDFLIPGLLGMSLMGGGLWGVGFVTVDMRIRKLLKRFLATPMKKRDFLAGIMVSRLLFLVPEVLALLIFARVAFGVVIQGSLWTMAFLILLGAVTFAGIGLLVASRAKTIEAVSGLMNLVMLPMWVLSGIFFSSERFPDFVQPFVKILPLTPLIDALRAVSLEGATFAEQLPRIGILAAWGVVSFVLALRWFRWS